MLFLLSLLPFVVSDFASCPADIPESCSQNGPTDNTCCYENPGGTLLQTQFWDYDPATGPSDSFTLHGLWPDLCTGGYDSNCNTDWAITDAKSIVNSFDPSLEQEMETYWKDYQGDDASLWEHEFNKHGTCVNTIAPSCYTDFKKNQNVYDYFRITVGLYKTLPTYDWLTAEGIVPSTSATYTSDQIDAALSKHFGKKVYFSCDSNNALNEVWYYHHLQGPLTGNKFVKIDRTGTGKCKSTGIKFVPKGSSAPTTLKTTTTKAATTTKTTPGGTSTPSAGSKGYLNISNGCLISKGVYYTQGTCATFTFGDSGSIKSSKGGCGVTDGKFTCGSASGSFDYNNGLVGYNGVYKWCISGSGDQKDVSISDGSCDGVDLSFQSI